MGQVTKLRLSCYLVLLSKRPINLISLSLSLYQLIAKPGNKTATVPWPNPDGVGAAPTGHAPTTSEWSTISLPTKVQLILEIWQYHHFDWIFVTGCTESCHFDKWWWKFHQHDNIFISVCESGMSDLLYKYIFEIALKTYVLFKLHWISRAFLWCIIEHSKKITAIFCAL